jgi:hypothetical protein
MRLLRPPGGATGWHNIYWNAMVNTVSKVMYNKFDNCSVNVHLRRIAEFFL